MDFFLAFLISLGASVVGVLCGVGGGVVIKPTMDLIGLVDVATASFLSGCTVLVMTSYSTARSLLSGDNVIDFKNITPLAVGSAAGGVAGKLLFDLVGKQLPYPDRIGAVQGALLLLICAATAVYTLNKAKIRTLKLHSPLICSLTGLFLGILSSFLGIGGGPINLVVLYYLFSMETKEAAQNSLFIILFSQIFSLLYTLVSGKVPEFNAVLLLLMAAGGLAGAMLGRRINRKINAQAVEKLFIALLGVISLISAYNIFRYI